ncbi:MAG: hypothetical protein GF418_02695 [Chitinivibrionales bacterium]|nr:hypothetical protein [Chitinivibrionales bacterium]MBD3394510.1 hypothetical protein [Chitinivibrionales bacterium]
MQIITIGYIFCARMSDNNPLLSSYKGDYRLGPVWTALPGTLEVFRGYSVACTTGADTLPYRC